MAILLTASKVKERNVNYYVKALTDKRAILVSEDGYQLAEYATVEVAVSACLAECLVRPTCIESRSNYLEYSPIDFESNYLVN